MRIAFTITLGLFLGLAVAAQAQDDHGPDRAGQRPGFGRGPDGGRFPQPNVGFTAIDTNGNLILESEEIDAAPKSLAKLDKDGDGQITSDEVRMSMPQRRPRRDEEKEGGPPPNLIEDTVKTLMAFDANGDGKLSRSELPERFQGIFDRGDVNKDGFLTPDEIRKVAVAQAPPPEPVRAAGRGGPDGERREGPRREFNFIRIDPILAAIDTNGDGVLSAEEIRNAASAIRKLDTNKDGRVTREEAIPAPDANRPL
jgi:Ca2+-binding EF-hand superfamily protein